MRKRLSLRKKIVSKVDQINSAVAQSPILNGLMQGGLLIATTPLGPALGAPATLGPAVAAAAIGPAIAGVFGGRAAELAERNSKAFAEEVREQVSHLDERKLDADFLNSAEFTALVIDVLLQNARTYEAEKTKLFSRIFLNSTLRELSQTPYKVGFIRLVAELSTGHIRLFGLIHERFRHFTEQDTLENRDRVVASELAGLADFSQDRILAYGAELIRYGVLRDWMIGRYGYQPGYFSVTGYGKEFAAFLAAPGDN